MATQLQADQLATTIDAVRTELGQAPEAPVVTFAADTTLVDGYRTHPGQDSGIRPDRGRATHHRRY